MPIIPQYKTLLGRLTGLGKPVYSLDYWFNAKDTNQKPDGDKVGKVPSKGASVLRGPGQGHKEAFWFASLEAPKPQTTGTSMEGLLR